MNGLAELNWVGSRKLFPAENSIREKTQKLVKRKTSTKMIAV